MQHNNQYTQKNKWSCLEELMSLLPEVNVFSYKGSIDRFGFSYILAKICGFEKPRRTFAEWVHGWHWHDLPTSEILGLHLLNAIELNTAQHGQENDHPALNLDALPLSIPGCQR